MSKKVLVLSSSPRRGGNSDLLCDQFTMGAKEAGHKAEKIVLKDKEINYCTACDNCLELLIQQSPIGCCTYNKYYTGVLVKTRKEKGRLVVDHT